MTLCRGSLFQLLYAPSTLSPLSPSLMLKVAKDVAGGMRYLHEQAVIHRDLKTQNILITEEYGAKVADFGIVSETVGVAADRPHSILFLFV